MRLRIFFVMLVLCVFLNGCRYLASLSYFTGSTTPGGGYWGKKGLSDKELSQFYWQCYSRFSEVYKTKMMSAELFVEIETEGQACMLKHGFTFKDASYPNEKLCSRSYAKDLGIESYMIFPACQAKYGKYRK